MILVFERTTWKQVSECTYFDYWTKPKALGLSRQRGKRSGKQLGQQQLLLPLLLLPPRLLLLFLLLPLLWLLVLLLPCGCCCCCCCRLRPYFWALPLAAWLFRAWAAVYRHQFFLVLESSKWHWGRMSVECTCKYVLAFSLACVRVPLHPELAKEKKMRGTQDRRRTCTFVKNLETLTWQGRKNHTNLPCWSKIGGFTIKSSGHLFIAG